jgi:hypothetical protein
MRHARVSAIALVLAALPAKASSQSDWWDWTLHEVAVQVRVGIGGGSTRVRDVPAVVYTEPRRAPVLRRNDDRYDGRYSDRDRRNDKGPAFCRNGSGHPVFGRRWCVEKGYGLGGASTHALRWDRQHWNDVYFGRHWYRTRSDYVDGRVLVDVLGRGTWGRLDLLRRHAGSRYALSGRWVRPGGRALVLQIRSGPTAIAELSDLDGDGRVDVVMVARF